MSKKNAIAEYILERMQGGEIRTGGRIPSQSTLMRRFSCSRTTVVHAVEELRRRGFVEGRQGSGVFAQRTTPHSGIERIVAVNLLYSSPNNPYSMLVQHLGDDLPVLHVGASQVMTHHELLSRPNQAVIWMTPPETMLGQMEHLQKLGVPQLLINRDYAGFDAVWTDPAASLREGLAWLFIEGGRELAFITPPATRERPYLAGRIIAFYESCLTLHGHLSHESIFKFELRDIVTEIDPVTRAIFTRPDPPQAIFCMDFQYVLPFVICATGYGKELGRDYHLLTFDLVPGLEKRRGLAMMEQSFHLFRLEIENWLRTAGTAGAPPFRKALKCTLRTVAQPDA